MVVASEKLWKEGGGYYFETAEQLRRSPILPNPKRLWDQRIIALLKRHVNWSAAPHILEIGCGRSPWLAYFGQQENCSVAGIDIEPLAVELTRANLIGARARAEVFCRDAFDLKGNQDLIAQFDFVYSWGVMEHFDDPRHRAELLSHYVRPGGRLLTIVPNLHGVNKVLQRFADLERYQMHVIYDPGKLARVHEDAGLKTLEVGYIGFCDGWLTASQPTTPALRRRIHERVCWMLGMSTEAWCRTGGKLFAPEFPWLAPHVFYVGERKDGRSN
ncbi:MAG TPA: class I SAM-dependent methyltransferase [Candidatus Binatia bacterium]|jgi:2-polyprenyl-6-hydroxyphenyl methylase/3-demethylubiquinone-9 3-methyltransferase